MRRSLAFAILLALVGPRMASADWLSLRSDHFHVIGNAAEGDLRNVALRFEQFREVISQLSPDLLGADNAPPVVILVFKDKNSFKPFMPVENGAPIPVAGFFQSGEDVNYIALTLESQGEGFRVVFHEYTHLLLRGVFADAPLWFNEGVAEYYSTFQVPSPRRADIGRPVQSHLRLLQSQRVSFARFFEIDRYSPEYTKDSTSRILLYAQAWAIVHHAFHGEPNRRDQLFTFVAKLADGGSTEESFRAAYGMEVRELEREVQLYVQQFNHRYRSFEFRDDLVGHIESRPAAMSDAEANAWLGDLLWHMDRYEDATALLEKTLAANKDLPRAHASLGALQMRQGKTADGIAHLKQAQALGIANETAHFLYADALVSQPEPGPDALREASDALKRALALRPGFTEAKLLLAYVYVALREDAAARDLLIPVVRAEPNNHRAALRLGEALLRLDDIAGARDVLGPVIARTTDETEKERARNLLGRSADVPGQRNAPANTPVFRTLADGERRDTGMFESIECGPKGVVFVVRTAESVLRVRADRFEDVEFISYRTLAAQTIGCGAQSPPVEVYLTWRLPSGSAKASEGTAVAIEVLPDR